MLMNLISEVTGRHEAHSNATETKSNNIPIFALTFLSSVETRRNHLVLLQKCSLVIINLES